MRDEVYRSVRLAEKVFYRITQVIAVALTIVLLGAAELRLTPELRMDMLEADCPPYLFGDAPPPGALAAFVPALPGYEETSSDVRVTDGR